MSNFIEPKNASHQNGLFAAADQVPASDPAIGWGSNQGWQIEYAAPTGDIRGCADYSVCEPADPAVAIFLPFLLQETAGCRAGVSTLPSVLGEQKAHADAWFNANREGWIERALEVGGPGANAGTQFTSFPDLTSATVVTTIEQAASLLLHNRYNVGMYNRPIIHIPAYASPFLVTTDGIERVADIVWGTGYGIDGSVQIGPKSFWMYITGRIEYAMTTPSQDSAESANAERQNRSWILEQGLVAYRFAPIGCYKVKVVMP